MYPRLRYVYLITAGLLLPLGVSPQIPGTSFKPLGMPAQAQMVSGPIAEQEEWQEYLSTQGGFSVLMPGKPTEEILPAKPEEEGGDTHKFFLEIKDGAYGVSYTDFPNVLKQLNPSDIDELFNKVRDGFIENGKLLRERKISLDGLPGREIELVKEGFITKARLYWANQRLYMLIVVKAPEVGFYQGDIKFLDSFKLR